MKSFCTNKPLEECADLPAGNFGGSEVFKMERDTGFIKKGEGFPEGTALMKSVGVYTIIENGVEVPMTKDNAPEALLCLVQDEDVNNCVPDEGVDNLPPATHDIHAPLARTEDFIFPHPADVIGSKIETLPVTSDEELRDFEEDGDYFVFVEGGYNDLLQQFDDATRKSLKRRKDEKRYEYAMKIL